MLKVEILLPLYYNPDEDSKRREIEGSKYSQTYDDLLDQFHGVTQDNSPLLGGWIDPKTGSRISDENTTYWVICKDSEQNVRFLEQFKETLKERFEQKDILMYSVTVNYSVFQKRLVFLHSQRFFQALMILYTLGCLWKTPLPYRR